MDRYMTIVFWLVLICMFYPATGQCLQLDYDFQGRLKTIFTLRDDDGLKNSAYDDMRGVGWRNELKFDVEIKPVYKGDPMWKMEKAYLSYRGAFDAIFSLRSDRYDDIQKHKSDDYEYGRRDIQYENDLREAFIDITAESGDSRMILRLGRQIIRWGEASFFNIMNVVCPSDVSGQSLFALPEDTETPLWMARLNYSIPDVGPFYSLDFEFLAVPDIRPMIQPPLNGNNGFANFDAPYAFTFAALEDPANLGAIAPIFDSRTRAIREDVPGNSWQNLEYGGKLTAQIGYFQGSLHYFAHHQDAPAADFTSYTTEVLRQVGEIPGPSDVNDLIIFLRHPRQRTYGLTFNYYLPWINTVTRGEAVCTDKEWITDLTAGLSSIGEYKSYQYLLGFDHEWKHLPIGTVTPLSTAIEFYWKHFSGVDDEDPNIPGNREDQQIITFDMRTDYFAGKVRPGISLQYDPEGIWWSLVGVKYQKSERWWISVNQMCFFGNDNAINNWATFGFLRKTDIFFEFGIQF